MRWALSHGGALSSTGSINVIVSTPTALPAIASGQGKFRLGRECGWVNYHGFVTNR